MGHRCGLHVGVKEAGGVASRIFGLVHRDIGLFEQIVQALPGAQELDDANAGRAAAAVPAKGVRLPQGLEYFVGAVLGLRRGLPRLAAQGLHQHHELVTPQAGHTVAFARTCLEARGNLLQQQVAHFETQRVIELFEVVQVQQQQGAVLARAGGGQHGLMDMVHQQAPVRQRRERVVKGQAVDIFFVLTTLAQVKRDANEGGLPGACNLRHRQAHGEYVAIFALALDVARAADDAVLARAQVVLQVTVVLAAVGFGHQHRDVAPQHLFHGVAKNAAGPLVKAFDQPLRIDGDDATHHVVQEGLVVLERIVQQRRAGHELLLRLLACRDIAQHDAQYRRAVLVLGGNGRQIRPEWRAVIFHHPQLARPRFSGLQELFAKQVVAILVLTGDERGQALLDQRSPGHAQQGGGAEVGLLDQPALADRAIAHWRQVVEVEIACPRAVQRRQRAVQFGVVSGAFVHVRDYVLEPHINRSACAATSQVSTRAMRTISCAMSSGDRTKSMQPLAIALCGMSGWVAVLSFCAMVMPPTSWMPHSAAAPSPS